MLRSSCFVLALALVALGARPSVAQSPVALSIRDGKVNLTAQNVPLRTILTEWSRVGGTNVVGADRIAGGLISLELTEVPERQALDVLLRGVSGYLLALRPVTAQGVSAYNRIIIMPPSVAPRPLPTAATPVLTRFPQNPPDNTTDEGATDTEGGGRAGQPLRPTVTPIPDPSDAGAPGVVVTPANPFGVPAGSGSLPGVVTPSPRPTGPRAEPN